MKTPGGMYFSSPTYLGVTVFQPPTAQAAQASWAQLLIMQGEKTLPFLIVQLRPEDETSDGEFESFLRYGDIGENEVVRIRAEQGGLPEINLNKYSAIIVGGSPFNVSEQEDNKSPLQKRIESDFGKLFDQVVAKDFPFLGCCSGSGLLGSYLGGTVSTKFPQSVGGVDITLTSDGRCDPLLHGMSPKIRVLLGHKESCESPPPGSTVLAYNEACSVLMFRVKTNVYATQFHPEGDPDGFKVRIMVYKGHGYFPPDDAQKLIESIENEKTPEAQAILKRFVERYRRKCDQCDDLQNGV